MFRSILVPLDGSPVAEAALPYARALAERTAGRLTLLRATTESRNLTRTGSKQRDVEEAEHYLEAIAARLRTSGMDVDAAAPYDSPANAIASQINSRQIDMVVMATHDPTGLGRWVRGSIAEAVIRQAGVPVLVVCGSGGDASADHFMTHEPVLVVPLDGSALAEAALPVARDFAMALHGRLVLLAVVPHIGHPIPVRRGAPVSLAEQDFREVEEEARAYLESAAAQLTAHTEVVTAIRSGEPGHEINREAEERSAAAIVMATHGRTGMLRSLLGSAAGQVVHSGSTPVLLIHPRKAPASGRRIGWGIRLEDAVSAHGWT